MTKTEAIQQFDLFTAKGFEPKILVNNELEYRVIIGDMFLKAYLSDGYFTINAMQDNAVTFNAIKLAYKTNKDIYIKIKKYNYILSVTQSKFEANNGVIMINDRPVKCNVCFAENFLIINYVSGDLLKCLHYAYIECEF